MGDRVGSEAADVDSWAHQMYIDLFKVLIALPKISSSVAATATLAIAIGVCLGVFQLEVLVTTTRR